MKSTVCVYVMITYEFVMLLIRSHVVECRVTSHMTLITTDKQNDA